MGLELEAAWGIQSKDNVEVAAPASAGRAPRCRRTLRRRGWTALHMMGMSHAWAGHASVGHSKAAVVWAPESASELILIFPLPPPPAASRRLPPARPRPPLYPVNARTAAAPSHRAALVRWAGPRQDGGAGRLDRMIGPNDSAEQRRSGQNNQCITATLGG